MLTRLGRFTQKLLRDGAFKTTEELQLYLLLHGSVLLTLVVHLCLLVLHILGGFYFLGAFNLAFVALYFLFVVLLQQHKHYRFVGYALTLFITVHATVTIALTGSGSYKVFYLFLALVIQVIVPYASTRGRLAMGVLIWLCVMFTIFFASMYTPAVSLGDISLAVSILNVQVGFLGIVLELMFSNYIKRVIEQYNEQRLKELAGQANCDQLTGLYNRRYAQRCFEKVASQPSVRWCVAIMDVDNFKMLNDEYGHASGDEVLCMVAETMRDKLRKTDYIFRWGGEEFLILLRDADLSEGYQVMDELRLEISRNILSLGEAKKKVTVSIGVTELDPAAIEQSINICDQKMYEGKSKGKNIVVA